MSPLLPTTDAIPGALYLLDYFGLAVFAVSGALLAAESARHWSPSCSSRSSPGSAGARFATC